MKKRVIALMTAVLMLIPLNACSKEQSTEDTTDKLKIVTTIFPEYDRVRSLIKGNEDNIDLKMLISSGTDLHSFQPSADDIINISSADIFIYTGGKSDEWVDDALKEAVNKEMTVLSLLKELGDAAKEEEIKEGMEHDHEHEEEHELDEHIWLSVKNASVLCESICDALCEKDPDNSELYRNNLASYQNELASLDQKYTDTVTSAARKTLLFADRFPFRYLTDDYGLDYYAAFSGCSAESEASFETIVFLAEKINELKLPYVCQIESSDGGIARTVISASADKNLKILTFNSLQSVTDKDVKNGITYLSAMEDNLAVLQEALHQEN